MPKWGAVVLGVTCAALAVAAVVQSGTIRRLRHDVKDLDRKVRLMESRRPEPAEGAPSPAAVEELRAEIARVDKKVRAIPGGAAPRQPGDPLPTYVTEEDIREIVDARLEERKGDPGKPDGQEGGGGGDRKLPLHDIAVQLALDDATRLQVEEIANGAKREIFDMLKLPRADGTNMADEILDAFSSGDPEKGRAAFARIFSEKVPGTDATYAAAAGEIQDRARDQLRGVMGETIYRRFAGMNVKPDNIQTGWDPWGAYFLERSNR